MNVMEVHTTVMQVQPAQILMVLSPVPVKLATREMGQAVQATMSFYYFLLLWGYSIIIHPAIPAFCVLELDIWLADISGYSTHI